MKFSDARFRKESFYGIWIYRIQIFKKIFPPQTGNFLKYIMMELKRRG